MAETVPLDQLNVAMIVRDEAAQVYAAGIAAARRARDDRARDELEAAADDLAAAGDEA